MVECQHATVVDATPNDGALGAGAHEDHRTFRCQVTCSAALPDPFRLGQRRVTLAEYGKNQLGRSSRANKVTSTPTWMSKAVLMRGSAPAA
jgi:hypothetical protein